MATEISLSSIKERLYNLINLTNSHLPAPMSDVNVTLGSPVAMESPVDGGVNTVLPLAGVEGKGYNGNASVYYGRVDVSSYFKSPLELNGDDIESWDALAVAVNEAANTLFTGEDFNTTVWKLETLPVSKQVTISSESWLYQGKFEVALSSTEPTLSSTITSTTLNGLNPIIPPLARYITRHDFTEISKPVQPWSITPNIAWQNGKEGAIVFKPGKTIASVEFIMGPNTFQAEFITCGLNSYPAMIGQFINYPNPPTISYTPQVIAGGGSQNKGISLFISAGEGSPFSNPYFNVQISKQYSEILNDKILRLSDDKGQVIFQQGLFAKGAPQDIIVNNIPIPEGFAFDLTKYYSLQVLKNTLTNVITSKELKGLDPLPISFPLYPDNAWVAFNNGSLVFKAGRYSQNGTDYIGLCYGESVSHLQSDSSIEHLYTGTLVSDGYSQIPTGFFMVDALHASDPNQNSHISNFKNISSYPENALDRDDPYGASVIEIKDNQGNVLYSGQMATLTDPSGETSPLGFMEGEFYTVNFKERVIEFTDAGVDWDVGQGSMIVRLNYKHQFYIGNQTPENSYYLLGSVRKDAVVDGQVFPDSSYASRMLDDIAPSKPIEVLGGGPSGLDLDAMIFQVPQVFPDPYWTLQNNYFLLNFVASPDKAPTAPTSETDVATYPIHPSDKYKDRFMHVIDSSGRLYWDGKLGDALMGGQWIANEGRMGLVAPLNASLNLPTWTSYLGAMPPNQKYYLALVIKPVNYNES